MAEETEENYKLMENITHYTKQEAACDIMVKIVCI